MGKGATSAGALPVLTGEAAAAVATAAAIQIIAAAGSGKTEVVSQRVARCWRRSRPRSIVAFTFTERAAAELKDRIARRVEDRLGRERARPLGGLFVGTIHAYCFRLLQQHVPRYETYDVLDDNQLTAFLSREAQPARDPPARPERTGCSPRSQRSSRASTSSRTSCSTRDDARAVRDGPRRLLRHARALPAAHVRAADRRGPSRSSSDPRSRPRSTPTLRHLIVDEYQDVNPAQERLIELLTGPSVELCVVGDDDQAIYQWRGSDVANIVDFARPLPGRRDVRDHDQPPQPAGIIDAANGFAETIPERLAKRWAASTGVGDGTRGRGCGRPTPRPRRPAGSPA